jgi:hypothetical protein
VFLFLCTLTGETNGKSNNLNHCLTKVIYKDYFPVNPQGPKIPKTEVRCCGVCFNHCSQKFRFGWFDWAGCCSTE